jgi:hypothetical protein
MQNHEEHIWQIYVVHFYISGQHDYGTTSKNSTHFGITGFFTLSIVRYFRN